VRRIGTLLEEVRTVEQKEPQYNEDGGKNPATADGTGIVPGLGSVHDSLCESPPIA
jgi:hypothetical protein